MVCGRDPPPYHHPPWVVRACVRVVPPTTGRHWHYWSEHNNGTPSRRDPTPRKRKTPIRGRRPNPSRNHSVVDRSLITKRRYYWSDQTVAEWYASNESRRYSERIPLVPYSSPQRVPWAWYNSPPPGVKTAALLRRLRRSQS